MLVRLMRSVLHLPPLAAIVSGMKRLKLPSLSSLSQREYFSRFSLRVTNYIF
jgi:hypothetical protein